MILRIPVVISDRTFIKSVLTGVATTHLYQSKLMLNSKSFLIRFGNLVLPSITLLPNKLKSQGIELYREQDPESKCMHMK